MQDMGGNGKSTGLVGRIHDWEFRHPWIARPFWYFALLVVVLGVCHWAFNYLDLYHTDADSARYMLSAMVQAQAAIIAIVITLTLIAVQLTASAYSPRVIRVFRNNPDMWLLLGFYGFSMQYGLVVLKMVEGVARETVSQDVFWVLGFVPMSIECCVSVAYWLETFTLVALFPYMLNIIGLLKPENIINRLATEITNDKILKSEEDLIQPIMDIIHSSVMKYDLGTTRVGLKAVTDQMIEIIDSDNQKELITCFCDHFRRVRTLTVDKMDEEATGEVIKSLETFGKSTAKKNLGYATQKITRSIELTGELAAKKGEGFDASTWQAIESLRLVGKVAITKEGELEKPAAEIAMSIGMVGIAAAENERRWPTDYAVSSLEEIGEDAMKYGLAWPTNRTVCSLRMFGTKLIDETSQAKTIEFIEKIGKDAMNKGEKFKGVANQAVWSIGGIGKTAAERGQGFKSVAEQAAISVAEVGISAAEKGNEFKSVIQHAIESLIDVGKTAVENGLDDVAIQAAQSLIELTISNEEIVKSMIQKRKQYQGYESSEEFMNLYEQQLELRNRYLGTNTETKP